MKLRFLIVFLMPLFWGAPGFAEDPVEEAAYAEVAELGSRFGSAAQKAPADSAGGLTGACPQGLAVLGR